VWDATSFTRTATRLLEGDAADRFSRGGAVARQTQAPAVERALHGRLYAAGGLGEPEELWSEGRVGRTPGAGRNGEQDFRGERRANDTHLSTDPDARLYRKRVSASASRRPSAGPRRWPAYANCGIGDCPKSMAIYPSNGRLRSRPPAQIARPTDGMTLPASKITAPTAVPTALHRNHRLLQLSPITWKLTRHHMALNFRSFSASLL
jgi:hypothetical protein